MAAASNNELKLVFHQDEQVQMGSAVTLCCCLSPKTSAVEMEVRWFKGTDCVCLYKNSKTTEGRGYKGRVSLLTEKLEKGNITLQLRESCESDIGHYLCHVTDGERTGKLTIRFWWHPLRSLRRLFQCGVIPYIYIQQWAKKWSDEEKMKMQESSLLTEYNTDVKSIMKELLKKHNVLEETEQQLKNTKLDLKRATGDLENVTVPGQSGSVPEVDPMSEKLSSSDSSHLRIVLLGRTGSGKTAARNTILSRDERNQAETSTFTSTQQSESTQGEVAGRKVTVVDTPDWFSPGFSLEKLKQDVKNCVHLSAPGPHAFLLVIPVKEPSGEETGMLEKMEEVFGEKCWEMAFLLLTFFDEGQKETIVEFIQSGDQEVQKLMEKCGNRFHCLNIKDSGDGSQISELLEKVEKMVSQNEGRFHSREIHLDPECEIEKMLQWAKDKKIANEEREAKMKLEQEVENSLKKIEGMIQEHDKDITQLNGQIAELEGKMGEETDEVKKEELKGEVEGEMHKRTRIENIVMILNEKIEWERREMEGRLRKKLEEIRKTYEEEAAMEAERNLMEIMLPGIQRHLLSSRVKMEEDFRGRMEEKDRELELLRQTLMKVGEEGKESTLGKDEREVSGETVPQNKCRNRAGSI